MATANERLKKAIVELHAAVKQDKCRRCGDLHWAIEHLPSALDRLSDSNAKRLLSDIERWKTRLESVEYENLGCRPCFAAEAVFWVERLARLA